jgi:hypothetical protein
VVTAGGELGGVLVGTFGAAGTIVVIMVVVLSGATGGLTVDRPSPEQAANRRPAAKRPTSRWTRR